MKRNDGPVRKAIRSSLLAALAITLTAQAGEALFTNSGFDTGAPGWAWEDWSAAGSTVTFDSTQNSPVAGGATASGSLKLTAAFNGNPGYQQAVYTIALPAPTDFSQVGYISFDVKVSDTSTPRANGDYGFLETILRQGNGWDWVTLPGVHLTSTGWQRVTFQVPKDGVNSIRAVTIKLGENDFLGPVTLNIDNVAYSTTPDDAIITEGDNGSPDVTPAGWSWENWSSAGVVSWDPLDVQGRTTSGSINFQENFEAKPDGYQQSVFTYNLNATVNAAQDYSYLNFDVRVAPGSTPRANGDYGFLELILRNGNGWDWISTSIEGGTGVHLKDNEWHHLSVKVPTTAGSVRALTFKTGENGLLGPITLNVDNVTWTRNVTPPEPPSLTLSRAKSGLSLVTTSTDIYGRHNIYTADNTSYSFIGSDFPVSYSFTIDSFPDAVKYPGFQAHIFLVPGNPGTETSPDWNEPTIIFMDIKAGTNNSGNASLRLKTDQAGNNSELYASGRPTVNSATVLGTWTLTVNGSTITMTAPDGTVSAPFDISPDDLAFFDTNLRVYFGDQPNSDANKGQAIHVAKVEIKRGTDTLLSDSFNGDALNTDLWVANASAGGVQFIAAADAGWVLNWTLPDTNFKVQAATTLTNPDWTDVDVSTSTSTIGQLKQAVVPKSALPASDTVFFRMIQPAP